MKAGSALERQEQAVLAQVRQKVEEAHQAISRGRYQQAVELTGEGLALLQSATPSEHQQHLYFSVLLVRSRARLLYGDYSALPDLQTVRTGATDRIQRAEALVGIADCSSGIGDYQTAEEAYRTVLAETQEDRHGLVCIRAWIGLGALYRKQGHIEKSVQALLQARHLLQQTPDAYELGRTLINLGIAYAFAGRLHEAITAYDEALKCFRTLRDDHRTAAVLNNLGEIYQELRDLGQALRYHEEAITLATEVGAQRIAVDVTRNIGVDLLLSGRYSEGMMCLQQALSQAREIEDKDLALQALYSLGDAFLRQGEIERAIALAGELAAEAAAVKSDLHMSRARYLLGRCHLARGERQTAQAILQEALAEAHAVPSRILLWQLHATLGRATEDPEVAQVHFRIAADFIRQTAEPLISAELRSQFLEQPEIRAVLERAR